MEKTKIAKRFLWADLIRIVAIYFVVQIHTFTPQFGLTPAFLFAKLAAVSVPLFVMLSGALLLEKKETYKEFFKKRCLKVLVPWVIWTVIYMFYFLVYYQPTATRLEFFSQQNIFWLVPWFHFFIRMFLTNLWFLPLIFGIYILMPIFRIIQQNANERDRWYLVGLWFLFISVFPFLTSGPLFPRWEASIVYTIFQYNGYLFLGYFIMQKRMFKKTSTTQLLFLGLFTLVLSFFISGQTASQSLTEEFLMPQTVFTSLFIFAFLFKLAGKIEKKMSLQLRKIIVLFSKASLGVYIIHKIVADLIEVAIGSSFSHAIGVIFTIIIFALSTLIVILLQKIPWLKYIIP